MNFCELRCVYFKDVETRQSWREHIDQRTAIAYDAHDPMKTYTCFRKWFRAHGKELDAIVFDIDGVLVRGKSALSGSRELLEMIRRVEIPVSLLTNDGNNSVEEKRALLMKCGLEFETQEFVSSGHGLSAVVRDKNMKGQLFFVMGKLGQPCYAGQAGVKVTRDTALLPRCSGVIVGEENYLWEDTINAVVNFIIEKPDAPLIVPNPDDYFPRKDGRLQIASGAVARFIQSVLDSYGIHIEPYFLGKPFEPIFRYNHESFEKRLRRHYDRQRIMMLGDSLIADIAGALDFGYRSALLLTGITTRALLEQSKVKPDLVFVSL